MRPTIAGYRSWFLDPGARVSERDLVLANADVELWLRSAVYQVGADGNPSDAGVARKIEGAVYEQARALILKRESHQLSVQNSPTGVPLQSASIDGVSWTAASGASSVAPEYDFSPGHLCSAAQALLWSIPRRIDTRG